MTRPSRPFNARNLGRELLMEVKVWNCDVERVRALVARGADVNYRGRDGYTPLLWTAARAHEGAARILLENGADPDAVNHNGDTSLMRAVRWSQAGIVRTLLDAGADTAVRNRRGQTVFNFLEEYPDRDIHKALVDNHLKKSTAAFRDGLPYDVPVTPPLRVRPRKPGA